MITAGTAEPERFQCGGHVELSISPDCVANNVIFRCIFKKAPVYCTIIIGSQRSCNEYFECWNVTRYSL